jgi:hypothetical protein
MISNLNCSPFSTPIFGGHHGNYQRTHHFRETGYIIGGSDLYLNLPFVTTYQFGIEDLRWIEMKRVVINGSEDVLHRFWRLTEWKEIPDEISLDWTIPQNEP